MPVFIKRAFTDSSVNEVLAFLAVSHPRGGLKSIWSGLPDALLRETTTWLLEPLCKTFKRPPHSSAPPGSAKLLFENRTVQVKARVEDFLAKSEGVITCGPDMPPSSGVYKIDLFVMGMMSVDNFCRADVGIAVDPVSHGRVSSGVRWEAGDGDVFVASDVGGVDGKGEPGWLCDVSQVTEGVLPKWDVDGSRPGLIVDTYRNRLGFTLDGELLQFEVSLPQSLTFRFVLSWSAGTTGTYTIKSLQRSVIDTLEASGRLVASVYAAPTCAADRIARCIRSGTCDIITPEVFTALVGAVASDASELDEVIKVLAKAFAAAGRSPECFLVETVDSVQFSSSKQLAVSVLLKSFLDPRITALS
jgi:hypothetical protein